MTGDFSTFSNSGSATLLEADSTVTIETLEPLTLGTGLYQGTYTCLSDNDTVGSLTYNNNVYERNFEITDSIYSQDGIGNHPAGYDDLTSLGTSSFTGAADGLVLATLYHIKQTDEVSGLRVMLSSSGNVAGGEIYASIKDTATFWANDMTSLYNSNGTTVNATDITNGYVDVWFDQVITLNAGIYYACVELNSAGNSSDIRVLDDRTVDQPNDASAIFIPGDQSYTNGTATAIRMLMGSSWGVGVDENYLEGVSVYPNPSEGIINITNNNNQLNTIEVYDVLGKVVYTNATNSNTVIDLSNQGTGVYLVKVSNNSGAIIERVVIK